MNNNLVVEWNVAGTSLTASNSLTAQYDVLSTTSSNITATYNVLTYSTASLSISQDILTSSSKTLTCCGMALQV